jgi:hypothetical protein
VVVYPKGVWDKEDTLKMAFDPNNSAGYAFVRTAKDAQFLSFPLTTIINNDQIAIAKMVRALGPTYQFDQSWILSPDHMQPEVAFFY